MKFTSEVEDYMNKSVLCWLATVSKENVPNVSPKEIFSPFEQDKIIIANIASPQTVKNIKTNANVCLSFIDILIQKGFQVKGKARILGKKDPKFDEMERILVQMTGGHFPFGTITEITAEHIKPIVAPKYVLYPETTEKQQIESAKKIYGL